MEKGPNIFNFATSELSQDAFICWLAQWADPQYRSINASLHELGKDFISICMGKHREAVPKPLTTVEVQKQVDGLDILIIVNDTHAIMIEDKVHTSEHSNQLEKYKKAIKERGYKNLYPIYYKIINQSNIAKVSAAGYQLFSREDMLALLEPCVRAGNNDSILNDYYEYLDNIDKQIKSYLELPGDSWHYNSWIGFYTALQQKLQEWGGWGYVPNQSGGFLGFWWYFGGDDTCQQYIQLEESKLCFKIRVTDREKRAELRKHWSNKIIEEAQKVGFNVTKPVRFGNGEFMTVAVLGQDYRIFIDGHLDLNRTVDILQTAERVLKNVR